MILFSDFKSINPLVWPILLHLRGMKSRCHRRLTLPVEEKLIDVVAVIVIASGCWGKIAGTRSRAKVRASRRKGQGKSFIARACIRRWAWLVVQQMD